jgi:cAMP-dependent protein kinase regulator
MRMRARVGCGAETAPTWVELSLLQLAPRAATVSAVRRSDPSRPKLKCAGLDAHAFTRLLGPLREIMERKAGETYGGSYRFGR